MGLCRGHVISAGRSVGMCRDHVISTRRVGCVGVMLPLQGVWCEGRVEAMLSLQGWDASSEGDNYKARR